MKSARTLLCTAMICWLSTDLPGQVRNQVFVGARPLAMGETFVAVADDGNAIAWNPAGLPAIDHYSLYATHANLYNTGVRANYLSFFLPFTDRLSFGADWFNLGFGDHELEYVDHKFNFAIGYKVSDQLSLGLNLKHLRFEGNYLNLQQQSFFNARAFGWGADFGLLYSPLRKLRLGIMAHDLTNTRVKHNHSGATEQIQPRNLRYGVAYQLRENLLIAADVDDRFHLGGELWATNLVALRAGLQKDRHTDEGLTYAFGAGLDYKLLGQTFRFDYAYTIPPSLPSMNSFSLSILFDLFSPLVKIEQVDIAPVYASLYQYHSAHPIGKAMVKYKGKRRLPCDIEVSIPQYARPFRRTFFLEPPTIPERDKDRLRANKALQEAANEIPLYTVLNETILAETGNTPQVAEIAISYSAHRQQREEKYTALINVFHRNQLDWSRGVEQVAAFIDPNDQAVEETAAAFVNRVQIDKLISPAITTAKQIFEGLGGAGIDYRADPVQPYQSVYRGLDRLFYPYQILKESKQGDCDDLTVLYAALLENRNTPAAIVSVPEHIFLMFDTGIHERKRDLMRLPENLYHLYDGHVWIPVEVTEVGRSFDEAWTMGAKNFQNYDAAGEIEIVKVREAWKVFKPATFPQILRRTIPPSRDSLVVRTITVAPGRNISQLQQDFINALEQTVSQHADSLRIRNQLARSYALVGEFMKAEKHLRAVIAVDSTNFVAYNNLGNVYFLQGILDSAEVNYLRAFPLAKTADDSMGAHLNWGAVYYAADSAEVAVGIFAEVIQDSSDLVRVEHLLGIEFSDIDLSKASKEQLKPLSALSMKRLALAAADTKKPKGKKDGKGKKRTKTGSPKGTRPAAEIENVLFWAR